MELFPKETFDYIIINETHHATAETYETVKYAKICPYCHSENTWLVQGNECVIKEVEAETDDEDKEDTPVEAEEL